MSARCFGSVALALLGRVAAAEAAMDSTEQHVADVPDDGSLGPCIPLCLSVLPCSVLCFLNRPGRAAPHFRPLTDGLFRPHDAARHPVAAPWPLYAVDTHSALGELDVASALVHRALDLAGTLPSGRAHNYRRRPSPHQREPLIRHTLDRPNDVGAP
ncbi:hypothetical protein SAMN05216371_5383 [Streptomyces sp. TLI_053]|uniref:hypothetical protein n=1 Tax=Streptomyces sp. TLI_053 TaxID=1855352 RepID=UPI00087BA27A|nr:hypothetical protein [Streptomyces sp. TLI_053]SDT77264.1 hypothetical protein SAMN05216371_5383 [Streptomyces sp. TLI_053]